MTDYLDDNLFETDEDQFFDFDKQVLQILYYDRIDLSKGIDPAKSNNSKECIVLPLLIFKSWVRFSRLCLLQLS